MRDVVWLSTMVREGRTVARVGRSNGAVIVHWPDVGTLIVDRESLQSRFDAEPGAPTKSVSKLRDGTARALVRHLRGELTLHAAAVSDEHGALVFLGDSKAGKSTLAHAFMQDDGFRFLSDDLLRIEAATAVPSETSSWLDVDALAACGTTADARSEVPILRVAREPAPLRAAIVLARFGPTYELRRLKGFAAVSVLVQSMVRVPLDEPALRASDIDCLVHLATRVPIFELSRPKGLDRLQDTAAFLSRYRWL